MTFLYVGAYTKPPQGRADGIGVYRFDPGSGTLDHVDTATDIVNPSFLAISGDARFLYAVCEAEGGAVTAFARDPKTGKLEELNRQPTHGAGPCYVSIDNSGRYVLVANYGGGSIAVLPIADDGSLQPATSAIQHEGSSVNPDRQQEAHAHMIAPAPDSRFVLATDLGMDEIITYKLGTDTGELTKSASTASNPGAGPRHFAFAPNDQTVYVINELDSTLTVYAFDDATGHLDPHQTISALPDGYSEESWCAQVVVSPDGRFVYGSNRGHDSIVTWSVDQESGHLTTLGHTSTEGSYPRNFTLDPTGAWLLVANQNSDNLVTFRRDAQTGLLSEPVSNVAMPSAVALVFAGA